MMKLINKIYHWAKSSSLHALVFTGILLALATLYVQKKHAQAEAFLDQIDLQARNTSGATFYANKKKLFVGQELGRSEVIGYLKSSNFAQSEQADRPGCYRLKGNDTLIITPRLAEFQPVTLTFKHNRVARIQEAATQLSPTSGDVVETTIEPEALGAFITSINGEEESQMFVRRYTVQFEDLRDTYLFYAILASEDTQFMSHDGTRFDRILINLLRRHHGGSSITIQVIKNAVSLDKTRAVMRKVDEIFLASSLEHRMSKENILTLYVNDVFLGGGRGSANLYGFLAAADEYFGKKSIRGLTLSEACTLVAMLPKPNVFLNEAARGDYSQLTEWRDRILRRLFENWPDKYPAAFVEAARTEEVRFNLRGYTEQPMDIVCRGFIEYAKQQQPLVDLGTLSPAEYSGLHIYTSVDPDLMRECQRILAERLPAIERRFPPLKPGGCGGQSDRLLGAIVALNPQTGEIIAMSGGAGGKDGVQYSKFALNAADSPASTIKPFWVVKALAQAMLPNGTRFTAASIVDPTNATLNSWRPTSGLGGVGRPRTKLAASADDFAVYTLSLVGFEKGKRFYETLTGNTITSSSGQLSVGFGAGTEVSPLHLARAYTIFGTNGRLTEPTPISEVYLDGKVVDFKHKPANQVIDPGAAFITTQLMRSVLGYGVDGLKGTARSAFARTGLSIYQIEMAGKTGSGPNSVWMISVSPKLVTAVLLTYQCHSEIKGSREMYSRDTAAQVWAEFIKSVRRLRPDLLEGKFLKPNNVIEVEINPTIGCGANGPGSVEEFFINGSEPVPCKHE
jgi:membrane peptidoglycan carboxypeptidase